MALAIRLALAFLALMLVGSFAGYAGALMTQASDVSLWLGIGLLTTTAVATVAIVRFAYKSATRRRIE